MAADAPVEALKFSMPGLLAAADGGDGQTMQAITLTDGTSLIQATKTEG